MVLKSPVLFLITIFAACMLQAQPFAPSYDSSQAIADRIVQSKIPVLVDFWAAWCGPCRMLNPIIEDLEKKYRNKVLFVKVNVDIHRALSAYFGISSIPAVFLINNKNVIKAFPGVQPKETYAAALDSTLKLPPPPAEPSETPSPKRPPDAQ